MHRQLILGQQGPICGQNRSQLMEEASPDIGPWTAPPAQAQAEHTGEGLYLRGMHVLLRRAI